MIFFVMLPDQTLPQRGLMATFHLFPYTILFGFAEISRQPPYGKDMDDTEEEEQKMNGAAGERPFSTSSTSAILRNALVSGKKRP